MHKPAHSGPAHIDILRVVLIYALFGALWILFSDKLVESITPGHEFHMTIEIIKGWLYVAVTSLLLYYLLRRIVRHQPDDGYLSRHGSIVAWKPWQLYLFATFVTLFALLLRESIGIQFSMRPMLIMLMFPIILSAALGGFGPGLLSTGIATLYATYYFTPAAGDARFQLPQDLLPFGFMVVNGLLVSFLSMMLHQARYRSELDKRKAEASLEDKSRTMQLLDGIARSSTDAIFAKDIGDRFIMFNPASERMTGKTEAEVLGRDEHAVFPPEVAAQVIADNRQVMQENRTTTFEDTVVTPDGKHTLLTTKGPLLDADGQVVGMFGISRDITPLKAVESALRRERDRNQRYLDSAQTFMLALDGEGRVSMINRYGCELLGYRESEMIGENWFRHYLPQPEGMEVICPLFQQIMSGKLEGTEYHENEVLCRDGSRRLIAWHNAWFRNEAGNIVGTLSSGEDITARRETEEKLRKLSLAVEQSPESIVITNLEGAIEYVNEAFVRNTGYSREEAMGQNPRILQSGKTPKGTYDGLWLNVTQGKVWQGEFFNKRKDGSEYTEHAIVSPIRQPDGRVTHYVAVKQDITANRLAEAEIHRLAFFDTLTGLPNRTLLLDRLEQTLSLSRRGSHHSALIMLDIDRFKTINDAGGQSLGDALLKAMAERIGHLLREGDVLARISGDEFAILLPDFAALQHSAAHQSMHVAEKIMVNMRTPFDLGGSQHTVSVCIGVALLPENDADTPLDILRRANTALHFAKSKGSGQTAFFEHDLDEIAKQRFDVERELRLGIEAGELRLYLQPQVDAKGSIVGAEALLRWQHPQRGLLPPASFIPIAEESDLIVDIGEWVFAEVCHLLATNDLQRPMRIAVNISPRHFRQSGFVDWIRRALADCGADASQITLEITEGMVINNINEVIARMNELSALGIHFSMDDFGTGYSSLSYLKRLPINELKIDKTFIQDLTTDSEDAALVETILAVAKLMRLNVVAEGVETKEQAAFLNERATVIHQGYLFGKPEPAEKLLKRITR